MNKLASLALSNIETTGKALGIATQAIKQAEAEKAAAAKSIPGVVNHLVSHRLLPAERAKEAAEALADHSRALEVLFDVIEVTGERLKAAAADRSALRQGELVDDHTGGGKSAHEESSDMALANLVPGLAEQIRTRADSRRR